jgi:hypothetical protein
MAGEDVAEDEARDAIIRELERREWLVVEKQPVLAGVTPPGGNEPVWNARVKIDGRSFSEQTGSTRSEARSRLGALFPSGLPECSKSISATALLRTRVFMADVVATTAPRVALDVFPQGHDAKKVLLDLSSAFRKTNADLARIHLLGGNAAGRLSLDLIKGVAGRIAAAAGLSIDRDDAGLIVIRCIDAFAQLNRSMSISAEWSQPAPNSVRLVVRRQLGKIEDSWRVLMGSEPMYGHNSPFRRAANHALRHAGIRHFDIRSLDPAKDLSP